MGRVVSPGSISQLVVSLIQSSAMVLALQYQGCSSRGLLCERRKGVIILRPRHHGEVTGFFFSGFLLLRRHEAWDREGILKFKGRVGLEITRGVQMRDKADIKSHKKRVKCFFSVDCELCAA